MSDEQRRSIRERFEERYAGASRDGDWSQVPWARQRPNELLVDWLRRGAVQGEGRRALVVGCGLGDDAEELARAGFQATAIDISPTAVELCRQRFPESPVRYEVVDLFTAPASFYRAFDLVFEAYTLQALPAELRAEAATRIAGFVAPGGTLLVVTRANLPEQPSTGQGPDGLTRDELAIFTRQGLVEASFDDRIRSEHRPWLQYRAEYRRPAATP